MSSLFATVRMGYFPQPTLHADLILRLVLRRTVGQSRNKCLIGQKPRFEEKLVKNMCHYVGTVDHRDEY
jgi:hypothetical protein